MMQDDTPQPQELQVQQLPEEVIKKHRNVDELREHIKLLSEKRLDKRDPTLNGFDEEFFYIEKQTAQDQFFGDYKTAIHVLNRNKNRYSNVLPPENTRVKLNSTCDSAEECTDYINANFIDGLIPGSERVYIATQGPLIATFPDFWRMVWETNSCVIIMLTREVENGRLKCDRYWPAAIDIPLTAGDFKISLINVPFDTTELIGREMELLHIPSGQQRNVTQYQYIAWPDHGLPVSVDAFLDLAEKADEANKTKGPLVVHCSAGIGRSGTFCTVHATIERIKYELKENPSADPLFNIVQTVLHMRKMRPGMVQTKEQYMFCCYAIMEEAERLLGKKHAKPKQKPNENGTFSDNNNSYTVFNNNPESLLYPEGAQDDAGVTDKSTLIAVNGNK